MPNVAAASRRVVPWIALVVVVILSPDLVGGSKLLTPLVFAGLYGIAVVGLTVLHGQAGIVSLGQGGFVAVGAYTAGLLAVKQNWPPVLALLAAMVVTVLIAAVTVPILRISGLALSLVTFAIAVIMSQLIIVFDSLTGGQRGLAGLPVLSLGPWNVSSERDYLIVTWLVVLALAALAFNIRRSPYGAALRAQNVDSPASSALGIPVMRIRSAAWLFAAACAGLSGGVLAFYLNYLTPDFFNLDLSIALLAAVVIGGMNSMFGPLVAIAVLQAVPSFADFGGHVGPLLWSGGLLLLVPALSSGGIAAVYRWCRDQLRGRLTRPKDDGEAASTSADVGADFLPVHASVVKR